ncbi:NotI family restriction endonuclease [Rhodoferax sp. WC2427]|uniref:NotI family restriction endonuclease n=1 Tax=Rhodoferax sp. WC2427 TaxID=3234144 RepID=UPI003466EAAB
MTSTTHDAHASDDEPTPAIEIDAHSSTATTETTAGDPTTRFGIGEWYGQSFTELSAPERLEFSSYGVPAKVSLTKPERERLIQLRRKVDNDVPLNKAETKRHEILENKFCIEQKSTKLCPFKKVDGYGLTPCTKSGGVCSLRAYTRAPNDEVVPVSGAKGALRTLCPYRFHEGATAFNWASSVILGQPFPILVGEVGFLESSETYDGSEGEDVGRIDMVVVDASKPPDYPLPWIALEIQAVYFSGPEMPKLFSQIAKDIQDGGNGIVFPSENRRPDYRSSGPKRLMPQLQIKIPTLRRWGKRMAVVVDRPFYESMGKMRTTDHVSLSDVVWFVVDYKHNPTSRRFELTQGDAYFMTLEEAVKGLTGGTPVAQPVFEDKIRAELSALTPLAISMSAAAAIKTLPGS